jgi:subtilisin family serine protease/peptidoglycan hydrolase-like protein with peptidoglycan-binding domain/3',5'-cyclic AMP phosphodiesterase CpdA
MEPELWELLDSGEGDDEVATILRLGQAGQAPPGVRVVAQFGEIVTARLPRSAISSVRESAECASMKAPGAPFGPDLEMVFDESGELSEVAEPDVPNDERRPTGLEATGRGVAVGVVDWGFDFAHPDFRNRDGSTRILALWDQRGPARADSPQPFGYGRVHDRTAINRALETDDPYAALGYHPADADTGCGSHGTHVASIAAGNGGGGGPLGIAPEADLIFVHLATWGDKHSKLGDSVTLLEAIDFIARTAGDQPWSINLSMGRHGEQHDGTTPLEQGLDAALRTAPGRAICQSTGNYFNRRIHASGQLRPGERETLIWEVAGADVTPNELEIWYSRRDTLAVEVRSPVGGVSRAALGEQHLIKESGREVGRLYHRAREPNTLDNQINIFLDKTAPPGEWEVILVGQDVLDGRFHAWIERDAACRRCQSTFKNDDPRSTTGTICNGLRTLAVGAYNPHEPEQPLAPFSSAGPTRDGRVKPDLCAPGVAILAARSAPRRKTDDTPLLTRMSGTSMAAPHITGTVALMFEVAPRPLRIEETHNLLLTNACKVPSENAVRVGSGYLDLSAAVEAAQSIGGLRESALPSPNSPQLKEENPMNSEDIEENEVIIVPDPESGEPPADEESEPPVTSLRMRSNGAAQQLPVRARILWPALGFPAVIAPQARPVGEATLRVDATRCITVLLVSNRKELSKEEAARYLRIIPWSERHRRHIPSGEKGSFKEEELVVRNDEPTRKLTMAAPKACETDSKRCYGQPIAFGATEDGENGMVVNLAHGVRDFYRQQGMAYLHEIRVSESVSAQFPDGQYHLFWTNEKAGEETSSSEMALLLEKFAQSRRRRFPDLWKSDGAYLMREYEFEYGAIHAPYVSLPAPTNPKAEDRAEVLHPLFIQRRQDATLRVGHVTDIHVSVRADVYEENLNQSRGTYVTYDNKNVTFNNWNKSFVRVYNAAKPDSDVILLTGDLIDYGRGHWGVTKRQQLGDDALYQEDRNWFLFYYLLAGGNSYTRPVYTILGNHDWRLNPYTPFAIAGAPSAEALVHDKRSFKSRELEPFLIQAHGPGWRRIISYVQEIESKADLFKKKYVWSSIGQFLSKVFGGEQTADIPKYPTETTIESVAWYLLTINPFLDYSFSHPHGQKILMLDWAEDENVMFPEITHGRRHGINAAWLFGGEPGGEGPKARNCLTDLQRKLVEQFIQQPGPAKIIGIHAPPIGPWDDWSDEELRSGRKTYAEDETPRGSLGFATRTGNHIEKWNGHPFFAIRPEQVVSSDPVWGMDANWNSFERHRPWFIKTLADPRVGVRLVLSGHIHRDGLFATYIAGKERGSALAGERLIQFLSEAAVSGVRAPAAAKIPVERTGNTVRYPTGALYVNTTCGGPRGHWYYAKKKHVWVEPGYAHIELTNDGTIQQVAFRKVPFARVQTVPVPIVRAASSGEAEVDDVFTPNHAGAGAVSSGLLFNRFGEPANAPGLMVIGAPGDLLTVEPRPGDVICRRGEGGLSHTAVIAGNDFWPLDLLPAAGLSPESRLPGMYAQVLESGPYSFMAGDRIARRLADGEGRIPPDQMLLRPEVPGTNDEGNKDPEYYRWLQQTLNDLLGTELPLNGIVGPETLGAIRRFQQENGLRANGIANRATEKALLDAGASPPPRAMSSLPFAEDDPAPKQPKLVTHTHVRATCSSSDVWKPDDDPIALELANTNPGFIDANDEIILDTKLNDALADLLVTKYSRLLAKTSVTNKKASRDDRIRIALVDLTGKKLCHPGYAGWGSTVAMSGASTAKIAIFYAAAQLEFDLQNLAKSKGIKTRADLLREAGASLLQPLTCQPDLKWLMAFDETVDPVGVRMSAELKKHMDDVVEEHSSTPNASELIMRLGFDYIASLVWQSGLRDPARGGEWIGSSYCSGRTKAPHNPRCHVFQECPGLPNGRFVWKTDPLGLRSIILNALSAATFFTLLAQGRLVSAAGSATIESFLVRACSWFPLAVPGRRAAKCGLTSDLLHDAGLIEHDNRRYAIAFLTRGANAALRAQNDKLVIELIQDLDGLIKNNNP